MKTLIATSSPKLTSPASPTRLRSYLPANAKARSWRAHCSYKILVVRGKQVTADTLQAADELALVLRPGGCSTPLT